MAINGTKRRRIGRRGRISMLVLALVAVVAAGLVWHIVLAGQKDAVLGRWFCDAESSFWAFDQDGSFSIADSRQLLIEGVYALSGRTLTLTYRVDDQHKTIRTTIAFDGRGGLALQNVNGKRIELRRAP